MTADNEVACQQQEDQPKELRFNPDIIVVAYIERNINYLARD